MQSSCRRLFLLMTVLLSSQCRSEAFQWAVDHKHENIEIFAEFQIDVAGVLSQFHDVAKELEEQIGVKSNGKPVQIVLFRTHQNYLNYLVRGIPQARHRKAIYYRNADVSQIYAYQNRTLTTDLRHEITHALLHQYLPFIPLWLDEGLAEYMEESGDIRGKSSRAASVQWKARMGATPSLRSLESIPSAEKMDADAYRDSWAWTCMLLNDSPESLELLRQYLAQIHKGEAPGPFSEFAAAGNPGFQGRGNSYFRKIKIRVASDSSREQ